MATIFRHAILNALALYNKKHVFFQYANALKAFTSECMQKKFMLYSICCTVFTCVLKYSFLQKYITFVDVECSLLSILTSSSLLSINIILYSCENCCQKGFETNLNCQNNITIVNFTKSFFVSLVLYCLFVLKVKYEKYFENYFRL